MLITRLRLSGFKSFVDPTELVVEQGLTGVVGPNGCGKSNLVEALRWVMGESSAKRMRGKDMDDVIFGGTATRPARNLAEVSLRIDNTDRRAPAVLNEAAELEVTRRIERDRGSAYKVNGREVRARDVQLLFADAGTGARSAGLVSQGRIGAIINAKPSERRTLLEEAANIRGLHARRHEAEIRLKAAETNLSRLDDVLTALSGQLKGLRQQARQAARYRDLSERIRNAEAALLHGRWQAAMAERQAAGKALADAETVVEETTRAAATLAAERAGAMEGVPELREAEARAAATLQRLTLARGELESEERRIATAKSEAETRLRQLGDDLGRERQLDGEATESVTRLERERAQVEAARAGEQEAQEAARERLAEANRLADEVETKLSASTERIATAEARRGALERQMRLANDRLEKLARQREALDAQRRALEAEATQGGEIEAVEAELASASAAASAALAAQETAENRRLELAEAEQAASTSARQAESALGRLIAERDALAALARTVDRGEAAPVLDHLQVRPGYEQALGAALGEDLEAPLETEDGEAARRWVSVGTTDAASTPAGTEPLAGRVEAPAALARRLAQVFVAPEVAAAAGLQASLAPGQRLVTRDGGLWRWDGFVVAPGAPDRAAALLHQRNRLAALEEEIAGRSSEAEAATAAHAEARSKVAEQAEAEKAARRDVAATREVVDRVGRRLSGLREALNAVRAKLAGQDEARARLDTEFTEAESLVKVTSDDLAGIEDVDTLRETAAGLRRTLAERRDRLADARSEHDRLKREAEARSGRLRGIARDLETWVDRRTRAAARVEELEARRGQETAELERLDKRPAEIAAKREALAEEIERAEVTRRESADALARAEGTLADVDRRAREADAAASTAREERVRAQGALEQANRGLSDLRERIAERLDCGPEEILAAAGIDEGAPVPDAEEARARFERLTAERERMGPVNLRAEQEVQELEERLGAMETEKEDLTQAIARLRSAISQLNREGRARLMASFDTINAHFQELFVRLFGGGKAHLELVEDDDPLEAGLEIYASPPGKKLQILSLLSGGEQALTAVALVFAAFLTNPSPICVLDEVDAPLDDSNVDRFCSLLDHIADVTGTRFLIVTHHRLTMARMDRLFGVTMSERGVSQLVSVDLERAERLRQTA